MKKLRIAYVLIILICIFAFLYLETPFGVDVTDEHPCFVKQLIYNTDNSISSVYVARGNNKKMIERISIADSTERVDCIINSQSSEMYSSHRITRMEWKVNFHSNSKEDFTFSEIVAEWSDGTSTNIDVGEITIVRDYPEDDFSNIVSIDNLEEEEPDTAIKVEEDATAEIDIVPYPDIIERVVDDFRICNKQYRDFVEDKSIEIKKNDYFCISGEVNHAGEYGFIDVEIPVKMTYSESSKKDLFVVQIWKMLSNERFALYADNN